MSGLKIGRTVVGMVATNCYFVYDENTMNTVVFDPGDDGRRLYDRLTEKGMHIKGIVLTHGHFDHILGVPELMEKAGCKLYAPEAEKDLLMDEYQNESVSVGMSAKIKADVYLKDGEDVDIDGIRFKVIHTPGHTVGSCCYYFSDEGMLIAGDTLFEGSVGRTDLPTGNMGDLVQSIRRKLLILPDDTKVYPGHGNDTTLGSEKTYNPFF
ncbi:MAG: MBL fold metallo-hydrolase [Lachnospiraceae bacterium]|nr:MBL fold metallo-hydrolase [Lachnospiraceae bacterium]